MELVTPTTEPKIDWEARAISAENEARYLREQLEDSQINLEIANERWVKTINDLAATEVQLRKLKRNTNQV
jgi:hypothetical protein